MADCRYYRIGGLTVQVESALPITETTFGKKFRPFEAAGAGEDAVVIRHRFGPLHLERMDVGKRVYRKPPWSIYRRGESWIYLSISRVSEDADSRCMGVFSAGHTRGEIYHADEGPFLRGDWQSLSLFTTDQIWLSPVLADRQAALIHSAGVIFNGQGMLFVGHSEAGKSTIVNILKDGGRRNEVEILCDDRNIVRKWFSAPPEPAGYGSGIGNPQEAAAGGWRVHGTWSHGDVPDVSAGCAPLRAVLFLEQDRCNKIVPMTERGLIWKRLLATLIRPMATAEWWRKEMDVLEQLVKDCRFYTMHFDKSGKIVEELEELMCGR